MQRDFEDFQSRAYFDGLQGLRCIAILAVVWHHVPHPSSLAVFSRGFLGVDLFFVLSGFLIATLLVREKAATGRISLGNFWIRRFLRLAPAYYLMLVALLVVYLVAKPHDPQTSKLLKGFWVYALYLSNWFPQGVDNLGITWSLATEEQFYLVWPLVVAFAPAGLGVAAWCLALAVNQVVNFGLLDAVAGPVVGGAAGPRLEILDATFTPIILGVGLAHAMAARRGFGWVRRVAGFEGAPVLYLVLSIGVVVWPAGDISGLPRLAFHVAATLLIAAIVLARKSSVVRALEARPVVFVGTISYGLYLYHLFGIHVARSLVARFALPEFPGVLVIGLALAIGVATLSYVLVESRFLALRRYFRASARSEAGKQTSDS